MKSLMTLLSSAGLPSPKREGVESKRGIHKKPCILMLQLNAIIIKMQI